MPCWASTDRDMAGTRVRAACHPPKRSIITRGSLWKPIYVFIDRTEAGDWDPKQKAFLDKVQNWDTGVMRNEFHSLAELRMKIRAASDQVLPIAEMPGLRRRCGGPRRPGWLP